MSKTSLATLLYGTEEAPAEPLQLRAGPLDMTLERGKLWNLRLGDVEVWHGLGFVYRDVDWGTPDPVIEHTETEIGRDAFRVECSGYIPCGTARLPFRVKVDGAKDGYIRFAAEAIPETDIASNRTGLCLLHPMSVGGARVAIEHVDGRESQSTFPVLVPPWPPFMLIRAIRHEYARDHWARCEFDGDLFELEDQRNNSDASFKTYNRSNLMPRPYWLRAGVPIRQSALLWVERPASVHRRKAAPAVKVSLNTATRPLPRVGTEIGPSDAKLSSAAVAALSAMRPSHLHLAVDQAAGERSTDIDWNGVRKLVDAAGSQLRLDLLLHDIESAPSVLDALRSQLDAARIVPESLAIFPSEQPCLDVARERFPDTRIGGGTHQFFVQLHRAERVGAVDFASFTTSPIVHGTREPEVMLTLQALPSLIETLRKRFPMPMPVRIGPSTIGARSSPLGNQPFSDGTRRMTLARNDPRCRGLFGAAWSLGYVAQLATAGVETITLMSLTGDSGVLEDVPSGALLHPTYFLLSRLAGPARLRELVIDDPSSITGLAISTGNRVELLLANLTASTIEVEFPCLPASGNVAIMDATHWESFRANPDPWATTRRRARRSRHTLGPYAVMSYVVRA